MKLVRLIKMCLKKTCSKVLIGKNPSDAFDVQNGLKQEGASSPLLFNFVLEYAIRKVQENQDLMELNETQLLIFADGVNILGKHIHINAVKKNKEALLEPSSEGALEVSTGKIKYVVMSCNQNAGQNHNLLVANKSNENVARFKFFFRECMLPFSSEPFVFPSPF
jgi:hypothetical protein